MIFSDWLASGDILQDIRFTIDFLKKVSDETHTKQNWMS